MLSTNALRRWLWVHKWTSLGCTLFLLLLCVTGLPLIFWHEIEYALGEHVEPRPMSADTPRASVDTIVAAARTLRPAEVVQFVSTDDAEPDIWYVSMGETADAPEASVFYAFDARTAAVLDTWTPGDPSVMDVMFQLHYDLFAGLPGTLFLGAMGLLFIVALISGVVVYAPFMRKLPFGTVRRDRSARTKWLDRHNLLSICALLWLSVVGTTGVINTLAIPLYGHWQNTELADMVTSRSRDASSHTFASVDTALAKAHEAAPGKALSFLAFPGNEFAGPRHYAAYMRGDSALTSRLLEPLLIDGYTGTVVDSREMPWYISLLLLSQPLHFGDYGGLPLKILWGLLDLVAIFVLGSGVYLWLARPNASLESRLGLLQREVDGSGGFPDVASS
jgi:uncharacterized iron-regulated membrane protein